MTSKNSEKLNESRAFGLTLLQLMTLLGLIGIVGAVLVHYFF